MSYRPRQFIEQVMAAYSAEYDKTERANEKNQTACYEHGFFDWDLRFEQFPQAKPDDKQHGNEHNVKRKCVHYDQHHHQRDHGDQRAYVSAKLNAIVEYRQWDQQAAEYSEKRDYYRSSQYQAGD
jgi:hypothetical protein